MPLLIVLHYINVTIIIEVRFLFVSVVKYLYFIDYIWDPNIRTVVQ